MIDHRDPQSLLQRQRYVLFLVYISISFVLCCFASQKSFLNQTRTNNITQLHHDGAQKEHYGVIPSGIIPASFGLSFYEAGLDSTEGVNVYITKKTMCITKPDDLEIQESSTPVGIIIPRGGCSFEKKARNVMKWYQAENSNVKMVLTYDAIDPNIFPYTMTPDDTFASEKNVTLALFSISNETVQDVMDALDEVQEENKNIHYLEVTFRNIMDRKGNNETDSFARNILNEVISSFIITVASLIITAFFLLWRYRNHVMIEFSRQGIMIYYIDENRLVNEEKKTLLSDADFEHIPEIIYKEHQDEEDQNKEESWKCMSNNSTCTICLENYEENEMLRCLPCGHICKWYKS